MDKKKHGEVGFVYVFANPLLPQWVKIGYAKDWKKRLHDCQTYNPEDFEPVVTLAVSDKKVEKQFQSYFEGKLGAEKKSKEFFLVDRETAVNIFVFLAREFGLISGLVEYADGIPCAAYDAAGTRNPIKFPKSAGVVFHSSIGNSSIRMIVRGDKFVVLKESILRPMTRSLLTSEASSIASIRREREVLENDPTRCSNGKLLVDVPFNSSSRALAIMMGYTSAQGPVYWTDGDGRSLREYLG